MTHSPIEVKNHTEDDIEVVACKVPMTDVTYLHVVPVGTDEWHGDETKRVYDGEYRRINERDIKEKQK